MEKRMDEAYKSNIDAGDNSMKASFNRGFLSGLKAAREEGY